MNFTAEALKKKLLEMKDDGVSDFLRDGDDVNEDENPGLMDEKMKEDEALGNDVADMAPSIDKDGKKQEVLRMHVDAPTSEQADMGHGDERVPAGKMPERKMSLMERASEALKKHAKKA